MMCAVVGDSIGVGVGRALPNCKVNAVGGISAAGFDARFVGSNAGVTVISLGSNEGPTTLEHLRAVRSRVAGRAVWLLPPARHRAEVLEIARERGDRVIDVMISDATPRHIHPSAAGYRVLASAILEDGDAR